MIRNWMVLSIIAFAAALITFCVCGARGRLTKAALAAGLVNLLIAAINSSAPMRGLLDPDYAGYRFGLIGASRGLPVTILAGVIFVSAALAACLAAANRPGRRMLFVALVDGVLFVNLAVTLTVEAFTTQDFEIQFGEYLTLPNAVGFLAAVIMLLGPLGGAALWAARRIHVVQSST